MQNKKFGSLTSDYNPNEISKSVESVVKLVGGILVAFGIFSATDASTILSQVPILVASGFSAIQSIELVWGVVRKLIVRYYR